jgi:alpha-L-rhamnosidase
MLGQINEWFYRDLAGIAPDLHTPGFKNILIRPQPVEGINWAKAIYQSRRGPIAVEWKKEDGQLILNVDIPAGATATVQIPVTDNIPVLDGYKGIPAEKSEGVRKTGPSLFELQSGIYQLIISSWNSSLITAIP